MVDNEQFPMKVLMTADTVGGVWTYCMELCCSLPWIQFHLVTFGAPMSEGQRRETAALANVVVYESAYKLEWMDDPWQDIDASGQWLLKLEEEINPDLVHLNAYAYGSLPFLAPKTVVAHSDVFSWWQAVNDEWPGAGWNEYYNRVKAGLSAADLVIAPSRSMMKSIREIYGISTKNKVIYNGRSKELFYEGVKKPLLFSMGRIWDEAKNISLLVNAAPELAYEIRIAGQQQFEKNKAPFDPDKTHFLGKLDQQRIAEELAASSIYVLPAKYEPFGLSALEAAYSGCALVLGDIPSFREIWQDAAIYVDVDDQRSLVNAINSLMRDQELYNSYKVKAAARASLFSSGAMASGYAEVYQKLIQNKEAYV